MKTKPESWILYSVAAAFFWGCWGVVAKLISADVSPFTNHLLFSVGMLFTLPLVLKKVRTTMPNRKGIIWGLVAGMLAIVGNVAVYHMRGRNPYPNRGLSRNPKKYGPCFIRNFRNPRPRCRSPEQSRRTIAAARALPGHGSGPTIGTAYEAALILSESTNLGFQGLPMAQYDHGPKEAAQNSIVIQILANGAVYERTRRLSDMVAKAGAHMFTVAVPEPDEPLSILHTIVLFNFMAYFPAQKLNVGETFVVEGKLPTLIKPTVSYVNQVLRSRMGQHITLCPILPKRERCGLRWRRNDPAARPERVSTDSRYAA